MPIIMTDGSRLDSYKEEQVKAILTFEVEVYFTRSNYGN